MIFKEKDIDIKYIFKYKDKSGHDYIEELND